MYAIDKAKELTEMGKGKHHIGDFLPPEEVEKFVETVVAVKEDRDPGGTTHTNHIKPLFSAFGWESIAVYISLLVMPLDSTIVGL